MTSVKLLGTGVQVTTTHSVKPLRDVRKNPHLILLQEFCESFGITRMPLSEAIDVYIEYHLDLKRRKEESMKLRQ